MINFQNDITRTHWGRNVSNWQNCRIVTIAGAKRRVACLNAKSFYLQTGKLLTGQNVKERDSNRGHCFVYPKKILARLSIARHCCSYCYPHYLTVLPNLGGQLVTNPSSTQDKACNSDSRTAQVKVTVSTKTATNHLRQTQSNLAALNPRASPLLL